MERPFDPLQTSNNRSLDENETSWRADNPMGVSVGIPRLPLEHSAIYPAPGSSLSGSSYSMTKDVGVCFILLGFHYSTFFTFFPASLGPCSLQAGYLSDPVTALPWDQKPSQPLDADQELISWIYLRQHVCLPALQEDDRQ